MALIRGENGGSYSKVLACLDMLLKVSKCRLLIVDDDEVIVVFVVLQLVPTNTVIAKNKQPATFFILLKYYLNDQVFTSIKCPFFYFPMQNLEKI
mgnify:CR=1 FL=1